MFPAKFRKELQSEAGKLNALTRGLQPAGLTHMSLRMTLELFGLPVTAPFSI
jgi:hypothetical protein